MSNDNENSRILCAESQKQLMKARNDELVKIMKMRLVLQELQSMRVSSLNLPDTEHVERTLKMLHVSEKFYLGSNDDDYLLNVRKCDDVTLSYTERKAVRQQVAINLQSNLKKIAAFGQKLRTELPEIFAPVVNLNNQIVALEEKRRSNTQKLTELRNRKCAFLKAAAELKMGPYLAYEQELVYTQARMNQIKANVLRGYFINELVTSSQHSLKAIKEAEGYVNKALEQAEKD